MNITMEKRMTLEESAESLAFIDREIDRLQAENALLKKLLREHEDKSGRDEGEGR